MNTILDRVWSDEQQFPYTSKEQICLSYLKYSVYPKTSHMIAVVTRLTFPPELSEQVDSITTRSVPVFKSLPGFISIEISKAPENNATCSHLKWETLADHEACMKNPVWSDINSEWNEIMSREDVTFEFIFIGETKWT